MFDWLMTPVPDYWIIIAAIVGPSIAMMILLLIEVIKHGWSNDR